MYPYKDISIISNNPVFQIALVFQIVPTPIIFSSLSVEDATIYRKENSILQINGAFLNKLMLLEMNIFLRVPYSCLAHVGDLFCIYHRYMGPTVLTQVSNGLLG